MCRVDCLPSGRWCCALLFSLSLCLLVATWDMDQAHFPTSYLCQRKQVRGVREHCRQVPRKEGNAETCTPHTMVCTSLLRTAYNFARDRVVACQRCSTFARCSPDLDEDTRNRQALGKDTRNSTLPESDSKLLSPPSTNIGLNVKTD